VSAPIEPIYKDAGAPIEARVADLLGRMTLDEKLGQMTQVDRRYIKDESDLATYGLGSLLSGGGSAPTPNDPETWADMIDRFQSVAMSSRLGIPLLYGTDAVHGHNNLLNATIYPHNIGLGAGNNAELLHQIGQALAEEIIAIGPRWTFAPCLAVARNERWGRFYESAGEDPALASTLATIVTGIQGERLGATPTSVLACAKHYAGDGGTTGGVDRGNTELSEEEFRRIHIAPYVTALEAGVGSVMISYSSWNGVRCHGHRYLIQELLKDELGFTGFVVSDWMGINDIDELPGFSALDVATSVNAGIDMIMVPEDFVQLLDVLKSVVQSGEVSEERIDDAVSRILTKKFELGLFERAGADRSYAKTIRSPEHLALARQAVRESVVVLKNEAVLPLEKAARIFVAGKNAGDIGCQCGGWTISWQGDTGPSTAGTSILAGLREVAGPDATIDFALDGTGAEGHDVAVVVVGESPYAEYSGDRLAPDELTLDAADLDVLARVQRSGVPMVVVLVSGRPLMISEQLEGWQGFVAAWLPGSEGAGVADVLFGEVQPSGKLPDSWPRSAAQIPINAGDANYDPQFPFGFGLSY
jgi:beta-glucosidase